MTSEPFWGAVFCWLLPFKFGYLLASFSSTTEEECQVLHDTPSHFSILPYLFWTGATNPARNGIFKHKHKIIRNLSHLPVLHHSDSTMVATQLSHLPNVLIFPLIESYYRLFFLEEWCASFSNEPEKIYPADLGDKIGKLCTTIVYYYTTCDTLFGFHKVDHSTGITSEFQRSPDYIESCTKNGATVVNRKTMFAFSVCNRLTANTKHAYTMGQRCWILHFLNRFHVDKWTQNFIRELECSLGADDVQRFVWASATYRGRYHPGMHTRQRTCDDLDKILSV